MHAFTMRGFFGGRGSLGVRWEEGALHSTWAASRLGGACSLHTMAQFAYAMTLVAASGYGGLLCSHSYRPFPLMLVTLALSRLSNW